MRRSPKLRAHKAPQPVPNTAAQSQSYSHQRSMHIYDTADFLTCYCVSLDRPPHVEPRKNSGLTLRAFARIDRLSLERGVFCRKPLDRCPQIVECRHPATLIFPPLYRFHFVSHRNVISHRLTSQFLLTFFNQLAVAERFSSANRLLSIHAAFS